MKSILIVIILATILSCSTKDNLIKAKLSDRIYKSEKLEQSLHLNFDGSFTVLSDNDLYIKTLTTDTISYGRWKLENNFIILNSDKKLIKSYFDIDVEESFSNSQDSIYIYITNPKKGFFAGNDFQSYCDYSVHIKPGETEVLGSKLFTDCVVFPYDPIEEFHIDIFPNIKNYPTKISMDWIHTFKYKVKDWKKNNTYKISIPEFSFKFFSYKRINGEYIKIVDRKKDTLLWNNEKYIRKKK